MAGGDKELADLLARLIPAAAGRTLDAAALAADIRGQAVKLEAQPLDSVLAGNLPE
jgi:hypothetical protein